VTEPTDDEIEAARRACPYPTVAAALAAALPLVEARLREQIAADIDAAKVDAPSEPVVCCEFHAGMDEASRIARGD
jgi:hypothetical protein